MRNKCKFPDLPLDRSMETGSKNGKIEGINLWDRSFKIIKSDEEIEVGESYCTDQYIFFECISSHFHGILFYLLLFHFFLSSFSEQRCIVIF